MNLKITSSILLSLLAIPVHAADTLWLRPLSDVRPGEVNQLQLDAHAMLHAVGGEFRVVDAALQPLAGQFTTLLPADETRDLVPFSLNQPADATTKTPVEVSVDRERLLLLMNAPETAEEPRWLIEVAPDALPQGDWRQLRLQWQAPTTTLTEIHVSASDDLSHWYPVGSATLAPTAKLPDAKQKVVISGAIRRYLMLTQTNALPSAAPTLTGAALTFRPRLVRNRLWAPVEGITQDDSRHWQFTTPSTAPASLRYHTDSSLFAATLQLSNPKDQQVLDRWEIYRTATTTLAEEPLRFPVQTTLALEASTPLPDGQWQWGWEPQPYLFLPVGDGPYYLAYGQAWTEGTTGLGAVMPPLGTAIPVVTLGAPEDRPIATPLPWRKIGLLTGFIGAALLLLWLGYAQWRQLRQTGADATRR